MQCKLTQNSNSMLLETQTQKKKVLINYQDKEMLSFLKYSLSIRHDLTILWKFETGKVHELTKRVLGYI